MAVLKVVLADDENKIILLLQKLIDWKQLGYEIVGTANDGLRALELVRERQQPFLDAPIGLLDMGLYFDIIASKCYDMTHISTSLRR